MLTTVKEQIYADRLNEAKEQLKMLLNCLNADFKKEMVAAEKDKARRAIVRLLPVLDDLKANKVTQQVIAVLHLEGAKLPAKWRPIAPVATDPFAGLTVTADDVVPATAPAATEDGAPRSNWLDDITIDVDENGEVSNVEEVQCGTAPAPAAAAPAAVKSENKRLPPPGGSLRLSKKWDRKTNCYLRGCDALKKSVSS